MTVSVQNWRKVFSTGKSIFTSMVTMTSCTSIKAVKVNRLHSYVAKTNR